MSLDYMNPERNEAFDQLLDEVYPAFVMGDFTFYPSDILHSCDPIGYRVALSDYESQMEEDNA